MTPSLMEEIVGNSATYKEQNGQFYHAQIIKQIIRMMDKLTPAHTEAFFRSLTVLFYPKISKKGLPEDVLTLALKTVAMGLQNFTIKGSTASGREVDAGMFSDSRLAEGNRLTAITNLAIKVLKAWQLARGLKTHKAATLRSPFVNDEDFSSDEEKGAHCDQLFIYEDSHVCMVDSKDVFDSIKPESKIHKNVIGEASEDLKDFIISCIRLALHDLTEIEKEVGDILFMSEVVFVEKHFETPIHGHAATLVQLITECLLISSTSLDLIEKINTFVDPILELALVYIKPRACDEMELVDDQSQYYNRIELLFMDTSNRLACARSQFAYLLRNSTKQPGISAIMITKCLHMLNHGPEDMRLGSLTMLFLLLDTSHAVELKRTAMWLDAGIKAVSSNPVGLAYMLMIISQLSSSSKILEQLPLMQESLLANLQHHIVQRSLEIVLQTLIKKHKTTVACLAPCILRQTCEMPDIQSITTLMTLVNECFSSKSTETLAIDIAAKTIMKVVHQLDFDSIYSGPFSRAFQALLDIFDNSFGPVLQGDKEALEKLQRINADSQITLLLREVLKTLGKKITSSNISIIDDLIFKALLVLLLVNNSMFFLFRS